MNPKNADYPLFYYQRGDTSDRDWILRMIIHIPEGERYGVAREYERVFMAGDKFKTRRAANEYLHGVAGEYRRKE